MLWYKTGKGTEDKDHIWFLMLCSTRTLLHLSSVRETLSVCASPNCSGQSCFFVYKETYSPPCEMMMIDFPQKLFIGCLPEMEHMYQHMPSEQMSFTTVTGTQHNSQSQRNVGEGNSLIMGHYHNFYWQFTVFSIHSPLIFFFFGR